MLRQGRSAQNDYANRFEEISHVLPNAVIKDSEVGRTTEKVVNAINIKPINLSKEEEFWWEKLKFLQCPFSWDDVNEIKLDDKIHGKGKLRISETEEKIEELEGLDTYLFRKIALNVLLVYEHFHNGNVRNSLAVLYEAETLLLSTNLAGTKDKLAVNIKEALQHVVLACKAHVQFSSRNLREVEHTFTEITAFEELNNVCKAGIFAVRASTLMGFGYKGNIAAVKHIKTALILNPNQGEWHFLLGRCLGKVRRINNSVRIPSKEELKAFEEAVSKSKENPDYVINLAQTYREAAFRVFLEQRQASGTSGTVGKMNQRSVELYKQALEMRPDCPHINMRCGQAFMKFPKPYRDIALAKKCLDKALKLTPNNAMVNHMVGKLYEHHEKKITEAEKHYIRGAELGAFGAYMDLIRLRYSTNKYGYNPIPDLETGLKKYQEVPYQQELLLQMGSYHLYVKHDLETAFKFLEKAIDLDPESEKLKEHQCCFIHMQKPVSIYEVLYDKCRFEKSKIALRDIIMRKCKQHVLSNKGGSYEGWRSRSGVQ